MQGTMKCAVYHGIKNVTVEERPIPQIGASVEDMNAKLIEYFGPAPAGNTHMEYMNKALLNQFIEFMKKANMLTGKQAPNVDLYEAIDTASKADHNIKVIIDYEI
ncbi:MAG: hypothetical protein HFF10_06615 [Angelakisella sp.]|jgi:hypothetical protein|nr:hypothetical protein [Angelakisella sp.]